MREGIADGWAGMMRGGETCSALGCPGGSFGARRVFKTGNKWDGMGWDERGNMLEKSRWGDRRGLGFCMWAVFVSDPAGR